MSAKIIPFNPLDKDNLGASIAIAMLSGKVHPLGDLTKFGGAGIYALYYNGAFPAYQEIAQRNTNGRFTVPIYVGKAVPAGARKGGGMAAGTIGYPLFNRLSEHAESIRSAVNLNIEDFVCRYLVVEDIWIPLGESLLIARFSPVWNSLIDGFGNHDPGKGRYGGMRSRWDDLHPGREWAAKCQDRQESAKDIESDVKTYLRDFPFPQADWFNLPE
ncbi:MAG: Eco29kI family restriction endonuclease [Candidatus Accumulibacter sp.]|jgi:hypothetical protein|nr:Eco29kI family restriction endonuclease [Accumulibacter sp.]